VVGWKAGHVLQFRYCCYRVQRISLVSGRVEGCVEDVELICDRLTFVATTVLAALHARGTPANATGPAMAGV
jgi:hypothetical protein